jgi:hypothetical protein
MIKQALCDLFRLAERFLLEYLGLVRFLPGQIQIVAAEVSVGAVCGRWAAEVEVPDEAPAGDRKCFLTSSSIFSTSTLAVPKVTMSTESGWATPIT